MAVGGMAGAPKLLALLLLALLVAVVASPSSADAFECKGCYFALRHCEQSCIGGPDEHKCLGFCQNDFRACEAVYC
eukprot:contig_9957_g2379